MSIMTALISQVVVGAVGSQANQKSMGAFCRN